LLIRRFQRSSSRSNPATDSFGNLSLFSTVPVHTLELVGERPDPLQMCNDLLTVAPRLLWN
jgi:hypothetical protein